MFLMSPPAVEKSCLGLQQPSLLGVCLTESQPVAGVVAEHVAAAQRSCLCRDEIDTTIQYSAAILIKFDRAALCVFSFEGAMVVIDTFACYNGNSGSSLSQPE